MVIFLTCRYDAHMNEIKERLKVIGLTQKLAGQIVGLSALTVNRQVNGSYPLSPALVYLMETWPKLSPAMRERIIKRVGQA